MQLKCRKIMMNLRKLRYFLVNLRENFLSYSHKLLSILILIFETCRSNFFTFQVIQVLYSYMDGENSLINFTRHLSKVGTFGQVGDFLR